MRLLTVLAALLSPLAAKRPTPDDLASWRRRCAEATPTELGHLIYTAPSDEFAAIAIDEASRRPPHRAPKGDD